MLCHFFLIFQKALWKKENLFERALVLGILLLGDIHVTVSYFIFAQSFGFLIYLDSYNFIVNRFNRLSIPGHQQINKLKYNFA